ncbi:hypothetical protein FR943_12900 [Mycobacterium sp. TNTM28]|uniref:Uncharacterized protein n=1 Tax=[Mycobacterium] fortunisiensis TaxID=2600579 RepID=A0ABS6KMD6_9MYCO|nr:hypothetical protein [[Mycobacterium] fortunisiensis]MBU9764741.1 hypothetical protein [[Mycobacterium] fortunisiensis]
MTKYVVVCCAGDPIAYLADNRPGGTCELSSPRGKGAKVHVGGEGDPAPMGVQELIAQSRFNDARLTETQWADGHLSWTINCPRCPKQARIRAESLALVADRLSGQTLLTVEIPDPGIRGERHPDVRPGASTQTCRAHVLPLGVLNLILTQLNR